MELLSNVWDITVWFFWAYVFFAFLFALVLVLVDVYRDETLNGWLKALWTICLVFIPLLTVIVYVIARGKGMSERNSRGMATPAEPADYVPHWGTQPSASEEITRAQQLLQSGAITQEEFAALKARALT
ncbi:SHOCT domain-containing protein [Mycetocola miduiensis]|uniref:Short C-terminal domain-containing protein n=1 Tax=Mycetocola miduiensis TaxID=995034 RepID=A0A1I5ACG8_9MICO|nr:SHOCT domain-containing protein [Mycetocola miduiensis]SFN60060.1 Short C-terminal domain-containing protein [Mycetocola miduiensis]